MPTILHLVPDLGYHGHARQASLLGAALPRGRFDVRTVSLQGEGPLAAPLRGAGVPVAGHVGRRLIDLEDWTELRRTFVGERPALIHVWGLRALRALWWATLLKRSALPPVVVSLRASVLKKGRPGWWDRRLLRNAGAVVTMNEAERSALVAAGLPAEKVHVVPPGVPLLASAPGSRAEFGIPAGAPLLVGVGHLEETGRFLDAVWAYEILKFVLPELQLLIVGEGRNRGRLAYEFSSARGAGMGVHFVGARPDAAELVGLADVALVPHRRAGGTFACLEAMAAGRPVIASDLPHLAALVRDGETGVLVPPGDQPGIARAVRRLLEDDDRRRRMGEAARARVGAEFTVDAMTARFAELYERMGG